MSDRAGDGTLQPFPGERHDHEHCQHDALEQAEQACAERGLRLTKLRRRVLELIWASHAPVKAYDLLDRLKSEHAGAAPPTVYRALDFLADEGFIHRIESLNAYVGCGVPSRTHQGQFLICDSCGDAAELNDPDIAAVLRQKAGLLGFRLDVCTVELKGRCARCAEA
jgi:Fur family zinc uptake transcriptional regulator